MYVKCCLSCSDASFDFCCHIFVAFWVGICDNKVNTSFVVTFLLPLGDRSVTSQNVELVNAKGSLPSLMLTSHQM